MSRWLALVLAAVVLFGADARCADRIDNELAMPDAQRDIVDPHLFGANRERHRLAVMMSDARGARPALPHQLADGATVEVADRDDGEILLLVHGRDAVTLASYLRSGQRWTEGWAWSLSSQDLLWRRHPDDPDAVVPATPHHPVAAAAHWLYRRPRSRFVLVTWISADEVDAGPEFHYALLPAASSSGPRREALVGEWRINRDSRDPASGPVQVIDDALYFDGRRIEAPGIRIDFDRATVTLPDGHRSDDDHWVLGRVQLHLDHRGLLTEVADP